MGRSRVAITPERKGEIISLIQRWKPDWGRLTGPALEAKVQNYLGYKLTRIGMLNHADIEKAFDRKRTDLTSGKPPKKRLPVDEEVLAQRIKRLQSENGDLETKVENLLEVIARHHYNAQKRGITIAELEAPLNQARAETRLPKREPKQTS